MKTETANQRKILGFWLLLIGAAILIGGACVVHASLCADNTTCSIGTGLPCAGAACVKSTCTPGTVGTLTVTVTTDAACTTGGTCSSGGCAAGDQYTAQATLNYTGCTAPGCVNTQRTLLVCETWTECTNGTVCSNCQTVNMTPGSGIPTVLAVSACNPGALGTYQYQIEVRDVTNTICTTCVSPNSCLNGCAGNCGPPARAASCCIS